MLITATKKDNEENAFKVLRKRSIKLALDEPRVVVEGNAEENLEVIFLQCIFRFVTASSILECKVKARTPSGYRKTKIDANILHQVIVGEKRILLETQACA